MNENTCQQKTNLIRWTRKQSKHDNEFSGDQMIKHNSFQQQKHHNTIITIGGQEAGGKNIVKKSFRI